MGRKSASMVMTPVGDRLRLFLLAAFVAVLVLRPTAAAAGYAPPAMRDAVTDTSGKLTEAEDRALEERITAYRTRTGNEIAVFVAGSLEGQSIEDVAYETFNTWGIGKKGLDNGVLLVIAPTERETRIETGKGVGDRLTDIDCAIILRERVGPLLKQGRFVEAIESAIDAIEALLDGEAPPSLPAALVAMPLVRGAYVVDAADAVPAAALEALEADAAREGRYWADFAIVVVKDLDAKVSPQIFQEISRKRASMRSPFMTSSWMLVRVSASDRKVDVLGTVVWHDYDMPARMKRLDAVAQAASGLTEALRAVAASQVTEAKAREAKQREEARMEAARQIEQERENRRLFIGIGVFAAVVIGGMVFFIRRAVQRGWVDGSSHGSSSSNASYGASYTPSSYSSSSSSSSSSDTSYTGGGGTSGGGGASDRY